ncbi:flagellar basal-body MS-ring/collar protein FliF [Govanella unica]|uniref:Flagellar M-ring protein n=1 Tax=Govanella unica TaxID=2975056 RepID=A0A9X3TWG4_9PROT|nr:flagellar basal-body MS-ring/collar protein FliF [Govania unica]MDA5193016.1 flagellar basal-body MS-ring/collar protein FliF [Govania unica]
MLQFFRGLGPTRLAAMAAVGATLIAFFFFITMRLAEPKMALLYSDLESGDSAKIIAKLQGMTIPYQASEDGSTILVPSDKVLDLRMNIAQENIVGSGSIGYELFDKSDALGTTSFVQNINHVRALEGELARTIRSINSIISARVHLVLPQRELFSREERKPSASIAVKTRGSSLNAGQIRAIQNLVASAVPDLEPTRVSIIDHRGVLLAKGISGDETDMLASTMEEKRINYERRLREQIETLLERSVGLGKVRAEVAVEMDMSRVTTNSELYDPESQVARSTVTVNDHSNESQNNKDAGVSVATNLPDADTQQAGNAQTNSTMAARSEETVNYEISRTTKVEVHEAGTVKKLSVAVLVDGNYVTGPNGESNYTPRSPEELAKLTALVRSSMGFDEKRGDHADVINMRFADVEGSAPSAIDINILGFKKDDLFRLAEIFVLGLVGILVIFLVLRPLINRISGQGTPALTGPGGDFGGPQMGTLLGSDMVALPPAGNLPQFPVDENGRPLTARQIAERPGGLETAIEVASIESRVQGSAVKKVGELIERHPEEAAAVVRNWLYGS